MNKMSLSEAFQYPGDHVVIDDKRTGDLRVIKFSELKKEHYDKILEKGNKEECEEFSSCSNCGVNLTHVEKDMNFDICDQCEIKGVY